MHAHLKDLEQAFTPEGDVDEDRLHALPREVGVLLVSIGAAGLVLPGPIGTPFLLMGGALLWPRLFGRLERSFQDRCPRAHRQAVRQLRRFLDDLERRYPSDQPHAPTPQGGAA